MSMHIAAIRGMHGVAILASHSVHACILTNMQDCFCQGRAYRFSRWVRSSIIDFRCIEIKTFTRLQYLSYRKYTY